MRYNFILFVKFISYVKPSKINKVRSETRIKYVLYSKEADTNEDNILIQVNSIML
jgi:hypothetical protein